MQKPTLGERTGIVYPAGIPYIKTVGGVRQLFYKDSDGVEYQITPAAAVGSASGGFAGEAVELRRSTSQVGAGATRNRVTWQANRLSNPVAGAMWPCPELGAEQYDWVKILSDGIYDINFTAYLGTEGVPGGLNAGSGEWTIAVWKKKAAIPGQTAANEWLGIAFSKPYNSENTVPERPLQFVAVSVALLAGDYVGAEFQSAAAVDLVINANPQADTTRPDSRFIYPRLLVSKVSNRP